MAVDPTPETFGRFMSEDDGEPVVMLNLLRFKPDGGRERYEQYAAATAPFLAGVGGQVIYAGDCSTLLVGPDAHRWDMLALARYPSRQAFAQMVANPDYQAITHLRTEALEEAVLHATLPLAELPG
jgi:uncharacterized protein (DUF1330 family)